MSKKMMGFIVAILVLVGFTSTPSQAQLSGGISYYGPEFGEVNKEFDEKDDLYGTRLEFKVGMMYGLALGYDISPHFRVRLEYHGFKSKTNDSYVVIDDAKMDYWKEDWKLTVLPVIFSGIYKFSSFYMGAGIGLYPSVCRLNYTHEQYVGGILESRQYGSIYDYDKPVGSIVLVGLEFEDRPVLLNIEARYIISTKAKLENFGTEVDLSGLQLSLFVGFKL